MTNETDKFHAIRTIHLPTPAGWKARVLGGANPFYVIPAEGGVPNRFHRWMQRLAFGIVWEKDPPETAGNDVGTASRQPANPFGPYLPWV